MDVSLSCLTPTEPNHTHAFCYVLLEEKCSTERKGSCCQQHTVLVLWCFFLFFDVLLTFIFLSSVFLRPAGDWAEEKDGWRWRCECDILVCLPCHQRHLNSQAFLRIVRFTSRTLRNTKFGNTFLLSSMWLTLTTCTSQLDVEENNYSAAVHTKQDLVSAQHVISHTLCHSSNILYCNYGRCNFKGSQEFRRTGCGQEHKRSIIIFPSACVVHMRKVAVFLHLRWLIQESF